ncbi:hypothetical protein SEA_PUPPER_192 [Gordonia phage Pupper]|uniref:Uncharacterized protein n=1 Tax=Gordonia phage Pupper TaxID=2571249 RepID=A0A4Y6EIW7_9CAUD|nr:hypothetical protein KHQ83_gp085 [Gordonia phage Pupper]QDF18678.1 hypothetical protein SEA_PUPPER_192 [Gordonia phage Pupper]QDF18910.1 hypothetical protein SEA_SCENTAE_191 [Gordonia phage SCentae]
MNYYTATIIRTDADGIEHTSVHSVSADTKREATAELRKLAKAKGGKILAGVTRNRFS